ncbi:peptidoglycan-binding protein [Streptomyces sp. NPDC051561]|uniref:peptidoglycan-binding protein n=1 Tax=Streptomyces sp. NPDC051561 TaxID=3365658 RepID=UPI0037ACF2E7
MSRTHRVAASLVLGSVVITGAGLAATLVIKSPAQRTAETGPPTADVLTAPVEFRVLSSSVVTRGRVTAGQSVEIAPSAAGAEGGGKAVVTRLPVKAGSQVKHGQSLIEISGRPLTALQGDLPAYRDLKPGSQGRDVTQLRKALSRLGHDSSGDHNGYFGEATKRALSSYYRVLGYAPLPAQEDGQEQVKAARASVKSAERRLQDVRDGQGAQSKPGKTPSPASSVGPNPSSGNGASVGREVERATEDLKSARSDLSKAISENGPMLPASEVTFLQGFPARVESVPVSVGSVISGKAMTVSAGALVIKGALGAHEKGLVRAGQRVQVLSETDGTSAHGVVLSVADEAVREEEQSEGTTETRPGQAAGFPFVISPDKPLPPRFVAQDVRVTVESASSRQKVLVVPITAVSAGANGKTLVTLYDKGVRVPVEVVTGTEGDGYVEIRPLDKKAVKPGSLAVVGVREQGRGATSGS